MASALPADPIGRAVAFTFCNVVVETTEILRRRAVPRTSRLRSAPVPRAWPGHCAPRAAVPVLRHPGRRCFVTCGFKRTRNGQSVQLLRLRAATVTGRVNFLRSYPLRSHDEAEMTWDRTRIPTLANSGCQGFTYISYHASGGIFAALAHTVSFWRIPAFALYAQLQSSWTFPVSWLPAWCTVSTYRRGLAKPQDMLSRHENHEWNSGSRQ